MPFLTLQPNQIKKHKSVNALFNLIRDATIMQRNKYLDCFCLVLAAKFSSKKLLLLFCWSIIEAPFSSNHSPDQIQWLSSCVRFNWIEGASPGNKSSNGTLRFGFTLLDKFLFLFFSLFFLLSGANTQKRCNRSKVQRAVYCKCAMQSPWLNVIAF